MPVVVGPTAPAVVPTPVTSTDGVLTITPRTEWAAAKVKVDFTQKSGTSSAWTVQVVRSDTTVVRGLDGLIAPRGICVGWDQEFTLGAATTWTARCYNRAGVLVSTSSSVSVTLPRSSRTWVKDLNDPRRSLPVNAPGEVTWDLPIAQSIGYPVGGSFPSVASDQRQAGSGQLVVSTITVAELQRMRALLRGGPTYFVQCGDMAAANGVPDVFATIGASAEQVFSAAYADRDWPLPLTRIARPATAGSSIPIPGLTFAEAPAVPWSSLSGRLVDYAGA